MTKLLVAGRCDAGSLRVARKQVEDFAAERGYEAHIETSAKTCAGCEDLKQAIIDGIKWENIPWRSSPVLFKRPKDEIIRLKDEGRVLMQFNELREMLQLRLSSHHAPRDVARQGNDPSSNDADRTKDSSIGESPVRSESPDSQSGSVGLPHAEREGYYLASLRDGDRVSLLNFPQSTTKGTLLLESVWIPDAGGRDPDLREQDSDRGATT